MEEITFISPGTKTMIQRKRQRVRPESPNSFDGQWIRVSAFQNNWSEISERQIEV
jgi:hypothetical protein